MQLIPLLEMSLAYRGEFVVQKSFGESGGGYGEGDGAVTGERIRGSVRWSNHPPLREDDVFQPDGAGVIATDDGAKIIFRMHGYSVRSEPGGKQRAFMMWLAFQTQDERYRWINTTFAAGEGMIDFATLALRVRVFACANEIATEPAVRRTVA